MEFFERTSLAYTVNYSLNGEGRNILIFILSYNGKVRLQLSKQRKCEPWILKNIDFSPAAHLYYVRSSRKENLHFD